MQNNSTWTISLPMISAILVIATLPPFNLWAIGFLSVAPIYIFIKTNQKSPALRLMLGGFIFAFIFSTFLMAQTILQFHWVKEAYLFSILVKLSFIPLLVLISLFSSVNILILRTLLRKNEALNILVIALMWAVSEWFIKICMFSIEYSILGYPAHDTFFVSLAGLSIGGIAIGGVFLTVFFMALINMAFGSICFQIFKILQAYRNGGADAVELVNIQHFIKPLFMPITIIVTAFLIGYTAHIYRADVLLNKTDTLQNFKTLKIATIQDQSRTGETFGKETAGVFHFKALEELAQTANEESPDILIYPFAPWDGVIYDKEKDAANIPLFNKDVFATSFQTFGQWEKAHVGTSTVFVTWATTYRDGKFFNEVTYWKNGALLGTHQKEHLFPFLDYTPAFSQKQGLYTTAIDGTPGTTTLGEKIGGVKIGALVCSEVTQHISDTTSAGSELILSIGSEAFFSSGIAGDLNAANAAYRAAESGKPVVRSNRFGPSVFMDGTGKTLAYMPFGVTGVLVYSIDVPVRTDHVLK